MKEIKTIKEGKNFKAISVGALDDIKDYELPLGPGQVLPGKVFCGQAAGAVAGEFSFQYLRPGQDSGFLHSHKTHEELYFILKGQGEYQVDDDIFPVSEGSVIRVSPSGKRALKNSGKEAMVMLCVQYKATAFTAEDSPMQDGVILPDKLAW